MNYDKVFSISAAMALTAASFVITTSPALSAEREVVVVAEREFITKRVNYADLRLASSAGELALDRRVGGAVRSLCAEATGERWMGYHYRGCQTSAWGQARPQMALAVERARQIAQTGSSTIAATAITFTVGE